MVIKGEYYTPPLNRPNDFERAICPELDYKLEGILGSTDFDFHAFLLGYSKENVRFECPKVVFWPLLCTKRAFSP